MRSGQKRSGAFLRLLGADNLSCSGLGLCRPDRLRAARDFCAVSIHRRGRRVILNMCEDESGLAQLMTDAQIFVQIDEPFQASVDEVWLVVAARTTLRACGQAHLSLSIQVVDDDVVRQYNRAYRQEDAPTDVLSFAVQEGSPFPMEMPDELAAELAAELGDLLLAFPYASGKAQQHGHSLAAELQLLVVHGTLHLLGYDHDTQERQAAMWRKQTEILATLTPEDLSSRLAGNGS